MIDFRPNHNQMRGDVFQGALMWMLGSTATFVGVLVVAAVDQRPTIPIVALSGLLLTAAPLFVLVFVLVNVRAIVAKREGLEVEGELVPWSSTSAPKIAFLSKLGGLPVSGPARAWIRVTGRGWTHDLMLIAEPSQIEAMAVLRQLATRPPAPSPQTPTLSA
jgi:hypothetical protein